MNPGEVSYLSQQQFENHLMITNVSPSAHVVLVHDSELKTVIGDAKGQKSYYCMLAYQFWDEGHDGALGVAAG